MNAAGHESGNAQTCNGRTIPWLQDDAAHDVWGLWAVTFRDCVILDDQNRVTAIYNLTVHDLALPSHFAELKALLIAAAGG